jgi:Mg-chelatase subunit ChlD
MRNRHCQRGSKRAALESRVQALRHFSLLVVAAISIAMLAEYGYGQACGVSTPVRLIDRHGQPVTNITLDQFRAEVDDKPVKIDSVAPVKKPGVVLILDVSPSMQKTWKQSIAAARQFVDAVGENVDLFAFNIGVSAYAVGRSKSEELLDRLLQQSAPKPPGGTALYDTLIQVADRVKNHNAAIVVISDGDDNTSHHSSEATASMFLTSSWPPVFALILDYEETDRRRGYFKKIPAPTSGLIVYPSSASKVPDAAKELADVVLNPMVMTVELPQPMTDSDKLRIDVLGDGKPSKEFAVLHAARLGACDTHDPAVP